MSFSASNVWKLYSIRSIEGFRANPLVFTVVSVLPDNVYFMKTKSETSYFWKQDWFYDIIYLKHVSVKYSQACARIDFVMKYKRLLIMIPIYMHCESLADFYFKFICICIRYAVFCQSHACFWYWTICNISRTTNKQTRVQTIFKIYVVYKQYFSS